MPFLVTSQRLSIQCLVRACGKYSESMDVLLMVKALHNEMQVHVAEGNYICKELVVTNGAKPGCVFAPTLFSQKEVGATPLCDMLDILSNLA